MERTQKILACGDCGVDLSFNFGHHILKGHLLCGFCRSQYNQQGFSKTRGQLREAKNDN